RFPRLCFLLRRSPRPDATSNNFFGLFEWHVTGVESHIPIASGAVEFGVFKRAVIKRSFEALVSRITDDHRPALTARTEVAFFVVSRAAVLDRNHADAALNRDAFARRQFSRPIVALLLRRLRERRPISHDLR